MNVTPRGLLRSARQAGSFAQNALEVARFGGLQTDEEPSPRQVVHQDRRYRLLRALPESGALGERPAVILVPPMMMTAEVYDVSPSTSAVRNLVEMGVDPWIVDFGSPEHIEGGLERTQTDHVTAVADAVTRVAAATGRDVHLAGYSQGGMFCYQAAAYLRGEGIASLIGFGAPVDTHLMVPFGLPVVAVTRALAAVARPVFGTRALPSWMSRAGFKLLDPVKTVQSRVDFLLQLHNREALIERESQRRFLDGEGFIAWPGPALAEFMEQFVAQNRLMSGGFQIEDRLVTLADITTPILIFVGEVDEIAPGPTVRAIAKAAPRAEVHEVVLRAGHFGLVVGSKSAAITWPAVGDWVRWLDVGGDLPDSIHPLGSWEPNPADEIARGFDAKYGAELAVGVGMGVGRSVARTVTGATRAARNLAHGAAGQLPRVMRVERVKRSTPISLGLLLDEQAKDHPDRTFFLFQDRAHTHGEAKERIDAVVRGLVHCGVRHGDHVGVLMATRPSAMVVVAAISRLGAVAVMLRPDGALDQEVRLGEVTRVVADPEHLTAAVRAVKGLDVPVLILGGGGRRRQLGGGVVDMERIDPAEVSLPGWFAPNPGRAEDLAFILFTGSASGTRTNRITNGRWSLSAFGTASAAALSADDTVYSTTPIHHPSGLLNGIAGAIAGGARLALGTGFDPTTFWDEARRYGATVVPYTWTQLRALTDAAPNPAERHHPVRLFIGSGMPPGLWVRVTERFAPAGVLEFYASTQGTAVLGNLSGEKIGSVGRPLPGSARVAIVRHDLVRDRMVEGEDGLAVRCEPGEVGMLIARVERERGTDASSALRGVFKPNDRWLATGDLAMKDEDGDHWIVGPVSSLVQTPDGPVAPSPIEHALGLLPSTDLVAAYGVAVTGERHIVVAAVATIAGRTLTPDAIDAALDDLPETHRPRIVRVVADIPATTWYRLRKDELRAQGLVISTKQLPAWINVNGEWLPFTAARRESLASE
ncbi:MAG: putative long chain acyl-CoA synthase [Glaciecola sp.]|jgi:putative long chain acyl-CoA synthase